jgi:hypothetical protein
MFLQGLRVRETDHCPIRPEGLAIAEFRKDLSAFAEILQALCH